MDIVELSMPELPKNSDNIFNTDIPPIQRLRLMDDVEFEEVVLEWAYYYLKGKYKDVKRLGGAGDMGRDIIGYYENGDTDIYQCKHYQTQLTPSEFIVEFGKLCYYTYNGKFSIPKNYYIVTSRGIGPALTNLIDNPNLISGELINTWDKYCKTKISKEYEVILDDKLKGYINTFDFSIVEEITPTKLIDEYSKTKLFKYRFGGGLPKRKTLETISEEVDDNEKKMNYIEQLIEVYREKTKGDIKDINTIGKSERYKNHFYRQRVSFHTSQALRHFIRDELIDESSYEQVKEEVFNSVIDMVEKEHSDSYARLNASMIYIRTVPIDIYPLGSINPTEKCGICHDLVNEERIKWIYNE